MVYRFENCEFDPARAELRRDGAPVRLEPQVYELLKFLVEERGRVVTREEIYEVIWGERIVSEAALSSRIRDARRAVGDDGVSQRLIKTVQRRGLRFVGDVIQATPAAPKPADVETPARGHHADVFDRPAVAVLPFECQSDDPKDRLFGDALTDETVAALSAWRYFPVISRLTTFRHRHAAACEDLASSTDARYLLTGAFRRSGTRIKILLAVTDTELDQQIWSQRINRDLDELVDLEEEIAAHVATSSPPS